MKFGLGETEEPVKTEKVRKFRKIVKYHRPKPRNDLFINTLLKTLIPIKLDLKKDVITAL